VVLWFPISIGLSTSVSKSGARNVFDSPGTGSSPVEIRFQAVGPRATRVEIDCDPPISWNVDGELAGEGPARFEVLPRALEVVVGPET